MQAIADFTIEFDKYFKEKNIEIKKIPDEYLIDNQKKVPVKKMKSAKQFYDYVIKENDFWDYPRVEKNIIVSKQRSIYKESKRGLDVVLDLISKGEINNALSRFNNIVEDVVKYCNLSSDTKLAAIFIKYKDRSEDFFYGFKSAFTGGTNYGRSSWFEGMIVGFQYKKVILSTQEIVMKNKLSFIESIQKVENEFARISEEYSTLYHSQEEKITELWSKNDFTLKNQEERINTFLLEKQAALSNLEETYENKLRLSKPAEYWESLSTEYRKKGNKWLIYSVFLSFVIVVGLAIYIVLAPNIFNNDGDWYLMIKNAALLTVITSISIYLLRILVKMAMSSYHLERDAKEREQLAYFYLSLINQTGITDKERGIVLNALFSRSDTGLLKGDSSPVMSASISDIIKSSLEKDE